MPVLRSKGEISTIQARREMKREGRENHNRGVTWPKGQAMPPALVWTEVIKATGELAPARAVTGPPNPVLH